MERPKFTAQSASWQADGLRQNGRVKEREFWIRGSALYSMERVKGIEPSLLCEPYLVDD
jgi:hypothetical protein